jgi:hippurate hydrolase
MPSEATARPLNPETTLSAIRAFQGDLVTIRRTIHRHPETAFEETGTAALVASELEAYGIEVHRGLATTGVVGTLRGDRPGKRAIGLRADMDALHIHEKTGVDYASATTGKMHACGHDGHTAMLLGAARHLAAHREFAGTVQFIFQPAEEGLGGARVMIEEGLFDRFPVDAVYGMHNFPGLPAGAFAIRTGAMTSASDTWTVTFGGTGGHGGAGPHLATDPTVVLGHFILGVQTIVGRNVPAMEPAVLSVGHIAAGAYPSPNIIPDEVVVRGTSRSYAPAVRDRLESRLGELARSLAAAYGCTAQYHYERRYPPLFNSEVETQMAIEVATQLVGADRVITNGTPSTGAEDFAFMLEKRPGAYIAIGNGVSPDGQVHNLHTPHYDFNDEILALGAAYWVGLVNRELAA